ncbi:sensor histidine kinase [Cryobacterium zhongshanensis]|uniref:histidine kinase n=1 Tax=Cryobacterium zhongshanensis TaxID=2928153 RepID=A0AA41UJX4_9MICO|nr:sensor histidine kinase [Cryobacterium zhongshanensis]MCI4657426.1 sensor domain-containing protein [Cryobacterium zhongshanensis]
MTTTTTVPQSSESGSLETVQTFRNERAGYGGLWRSVPSELGFLILTLPVAVIALSVLSTVFFTGVGMVAIFVGLFLIVAALYAARGFGIVEITRLRWAGQPAIRPPLWERNGEPVTPLRTVLGPLVGGHYWLYLLHGLVVNFVVSVVSWTITVVWLSVALGGVTYWAWGWSIPQDQGNRSGFLRLVELIVPGNQGVSSPYLVESLLELALGLAFLATLPYVTRGLLIVHRFIGQGMLGAWRSEALTREVADLSASRGAAVVAEDRGLRRLERDIHDGPQQRLVRLQMDLASAERKLETDPTAARALLAEAREQARDTLEELRALSRGLVPPILQDRGLTVALESLAARSTIPVALELQLEPGLRLPSEIERSAYFIAAELLTNAAKHSRATGIRLHLALRRVPDDDTTWLDLWVIDNGVGGAVFVDSHGLRGLDERLRGLRGLLSIDSPVGGPTAVGAHIPLTETVPASIAVS